MTDLVLIFFILGWFFFFFLLLKGRKWVKKSEKIGNLFGVEYKKKKKSETKSLVLGLRPSERMWNTRSILQLKIVFCNR